MRSLLLAAIFVSFSILVASPPATEKPPPHFYLIITQNPGHRLDWDFDNIIFGSTRDEVHPDLCATPDGQYLYACCSILDDEGNFDYLRLRWSTNGGLSWGPSLNLYSDNAFGIGRLAADNDYVYLVYEYFFAPNDIDIYLARLPIGSTNPEELSVLSIAESSNIERVPAIHSDSRDEMVDPYIYITHAELYESDSSRYRFHLSINRGTSLYRSGTIASFHGQSLECRSSLATGKLDENTLIYFACEAERSGQRGSMVYTMTSDDLGATWSVPQPLSYDHRAFGLPCVCAHSGFAAMACQWSPLPGDLDILYSFSQDSGRSWSDVIQVSPGESYDTEPCIAIEKNGELFHIGFAHFLTGDSDTGTVWVRRGTTEYPDSLELPVAVASDNLAAAGFRLGMCSGPNLTNLRGAAMAWTSYFTTGDLDVKFDAAWRGDAACGKVPVLPSQFTLQQNWPNPFNHSTMIAFTLNSTSRTQLIIYNIIGREIMKLDLGQLSPGPHAVTFDARCLPSGTYFYTLQAGEVKQTRRMIVLK